MVVGMVAAAIVVVVIVVVVMVGGGGRSGLARVRARRPAPGAAAISTPGVRA